MNVRLNERARLSGGTSAEAIYRMVAAALAERGVRTATLLDVGCGRGDFYAHVAHLVERYIGVDALRYPGLPAGVEFYHADLDNTFALGHLEGQADVVTAIETIEHLENPRALVRQLTRAARVGGWVVVTTPNQLSALSLATLLAKGQFSNFQGGEYPAHITALLPVDLRRIAGEVLLSDIAIRYSRSGRIVFTARHYPSPMSALFPRLCSDNVMLIGRRCS